MAKFNITVNGRRSEVDVLPDTPLLWVLRDALNLTGTKYGCGEGVCGACTVHAGDTAIRSCRVSIREADGESFTTIEGLSPDGRHPCQRAWLEEDVAQCGYCQPGMIMAASALLSKKPRPTDSEIDDVLSELVCRCGTYTRLRKAVHLAARLTRETGRTNR
jgi:isoquinoline 1-oxidoreductase alpha subunit